MTGRAIGIIACAFVAVGTLSGSCEKLLIAGKDTASCGAVLLNTTYRDSRSGFYFVTRDGAALTFSGIGKQQVKPHADRAVQPIDLIIFGFQGIHEKQRAVGECDFTNPHNGPSRIICRATTDKGTFGADFPNRWQATAHHVAISPAFA
jgi:hypothetical protein